MKAFARVCYGIFGFYLLLGLLLWANAAFAATAFYTGETVDGMRKICFYQSYLGSHAITIKSYAVCPVSIEVPD